MWELRNPGWSKTPIKLGRERIFVKILNLYMYLLDVSDTS